MLNHYLVIKRKHLLVLLIIVLLFTSSEGISLDSTSLQLVEGARIKVNDTFSFVHGSGLNNSVEYFALVSESLIIGVAVGNNSNRFPLSVFIVQKENIGMVKIIDAEGKNHEAKLTIFRAFFVSFIAVGVSNQRLISNNETRLANTTIIPLNNATWDITTGKQSTTSSEGGEGFFLTAKANTSLGEVGFRFKLSYSRDVEKTTKHLIVSGDLRKSSRLNVSVVEKKNLVRELSLKIDQWLDLTSTAFRSFLIFDLKAIVSVSPALRKVIRDAPEILNARFLNADNGNETIFEEKNNPIGLSDYSGVATKFGWKREITADGEKKYSRALATKYRRGPMRLNWRDTEISGQGMFLRGAFVYPMAKKIIHDPDVYSQVRINPETIEFISLLRPEILGTTVGTLLMTVITIITFLSKNQPKLKKKTTS